MKKYLLVSVLSLVPFTQAFAADNATIEAKFTGEGKVILQPILQPVKDKTEPTAGELKTIEITSTTPTSATPVPAGNYNISVYNGNTKDSCIEITNASLKGNETYKIKSSPEECGMVDSSGTKLTK